MSATSRSLPGSTARSRCCGSSGIVLSAMNLNTYGVQQKTPPAMPGALQRFISDCRSVTFGTAKDLRPAPHMKIYAEFDGLRTLLDVQGTWSKPVDVIGHLYGSRAKSIIVVFEPGRPVARKGPLDAGADGPTGTPVQTFKTEAVTNHGIFVARPGGAASDVIQPAVHRVSETAGDASKKIRPCSNQRRRAVVQPNRRIAFHGSAGGRALDTDHPIGGELIISAAAYFLTCLKYRRSGPGWSFLDGIR